MRKFVLAITLILLLTSCTQVESYSVSLEEGNDIINKGDTWVDGGCNITINDKEYEMELTNFPNTDNTGEYELVYTYIFGNKEFVCNRIVKVLDSGYPVVELVAGLDSIHKGETHIDAGITVVDDQEADCTIVVTNLVNINAFGSYTITYEVTDYDGNQTIITRVVNVIHD